jgi:Lon-like protease
MPFAIISPGPVTDLLSKGIKIDNAITADNAITTEGKLYSLSVFVTNPDSRPPGIMILESWLRGDSVVIPSEVVYKKGETTQSANAQGKKDMLKSEETSDIKFVMKRVGGPSAGLAFSLALIAKLSNPELIAGRNIAVTGTINEVGRVGSIGGIDQKLIAAKSAGATIAVIPMANCRDVTVSTNGLQVIPVNNLSEAFHGLIDPLVAKSMRCPL